MKVSIDFDIDIDQFDEHLKLYGITKGQFTDQFRERIKTYDFFHRERESHDRDYVHFANYKEMTWAIEDVAEELLEELADAECQESLPAARRERSKRIVTNYIIAEHNVEDGRVTDSYRVCRRPPELPTWKCQRLRTIGWDAIVPDLDAVWRWSQEIKVEVDSRTERDLADNDQPFRPDNRHIGYEYLLEITSKQVSDAACLEQSQEAENSGGQNE